MTKHSTRSPSSRHRWSRCAGSIREEAKYPEQPSGLAAVEGTHDHTLLEHCVKAYNNAAAYIGVKLSDHDGDFVVDADRAERVQFALDYIERRVTELGCDKVVSEKRVDPAPLVNRDDLAGTVDVQLLTEDVIEIIDYKGGMNPTDAREQLEQYAVGVIAELPRRPLWVILTVIQPKLRVKGMSGVTSIKMSLGDVMEVAKTIALEAAATDAPDAPLVPGDKQCKYCRAKGCAARMEKTMSDAGVTFGPVTAPPAFLAPAVTADASTQVAAQDPAVMSDERLAEVLEAAPLMRQMIEAAEAEALRRLESGKSIPGLKLVYGRGSQAWNLPEEQIVEKLKGMGVPKDAIYKTSVVSPAQAKKLTWQKRDGTQKTLSERQLKTLETEYISKLAGKLTVAPASDPRPAVVRDAAPLFQAVASEVTSTPSLPDWLK